MKIIIKHRGKTHVLKTRIKDDEWEEPCKTCSLRRPCSHKQNINGFNINADMIEGVCSRTTGYGFKEVKANKTLQPNESLELL